MRITAIIITLILLIPGCFSDDEEPITFNGRDLGGSLTYKFTLESADGELWSLDDQEGKVVILVFMFTRCDNTCPVTSQNVKSVQDTLTEEELEMISFVSVTVDWRNDSPSKLKNWTEDFEKLASKHHRTEYKQRPILRLYPRYQPVKMLIGSGH